MTAKFFTKKRRSDSTRAPSTRDTKQTVPWPRASTPVTTASGARRRQWSSITPSCYTLRQKGTARIADDAQPKRTKEHLTARTGYNSLPLRLSRVGWAGTVKPANRGAGAFATKPVTKAKDTTPPLLEREPLKNIAWNPQSAQSRQRSGRRAHPESEKRTSYVRRGSTEPPIKYWRTRETTQEGWQTGQDPWTTRNYAGSVRTENVRSRHFRTRKT